MHAFSDGERAVVFISALTYGDGQDFNLDFSAAFTQIDGVTATILGYGGASIDGHYRDNAPDNVGRFWHDYDEPDADLTSNSFATSNYMDGHITFSLDSYEVMMLEFDLSALNVVNGTNAQDTISGTHYSEIINGLGQADSIHGGGGADTLDGGDGTDILTGGAGADTFVFDPSDDTNTITDFQDTLDVIEIIGGVGFNYSDLNITQSNGAVHVQYGTTLIILENTSPADIDITVFVFV